MSGMSAMVALVVYQSVYGTTATFAAAVAQGLGRGTVCVPTSEAGLELVEWANLIVVGAPVHMRGLPSAMSMTISDKRPSVARTSPHPLMREWLASLPNTGASAAAFDTRVAGRFTGSASPDIAKALDKRGFTLVADPEGFVVTDSIDDGAPAPTISDDEVARARAWGQRLRDLGPWV